MQSEEVTYAQLTLPRGKGPRGYEPMLRSDVAGPGRRPPVMAKMDHSRSLFTGLLSPGSGSNNRNSACFSGPLVDTGEGEEVEGRCGSSLLVGSQSPAEYVIYNSPQRQGDTLLLGASARESKV